MTAATGPSPTFTVYTPCYNSAAHLHRVFESLEAQTFRDFEWLAIDDGSADGTWATLEAMAARATFPVRIVRNAVNLGLGATTNLAAQQARGRLFLRADSDDRFKPEALQTFVDAWATIPEPERARFAGVTARCEDPQGRLVGNPLLRSPLDSDSSELFFVHRVRGEKWGFTRTDVMRAHRYSDVDRYVAEGTVWRAIALRYRTRYISDRLRIYYRDNPGSLSQTRTLPFPRGIAYSCAFLTNLEWRHFWRSPRHFAIQLYVYGRHGLDAKVPVRALFRHLRPRAARLILAALLPLCAAVAWRDRRQGRIAPGIRTGDWDDPPRSP